MISTSTFSLPFSSLISLIVPSKSMKGAVLMRTLSDVTENQFFGVFSCFNIHTHRRHNLPYFFSCKRSRMGAESEPTKTSYTCSIADSIPVALIYNHFHQYIAWENFMLNNFFLAIRSDFNLFFRRYFNTENFIFHTQGMNFSFQVCAHPLFS